MKKIFISLQLICLSFIISAQTFEIRISNGTAGNLIVEMKSSAPTPTTANFVLDLVFGIKWPTSANYTINLGTPAGSYFMGKAGVEIVTGSFEFQAFGLTSAPNNIPADWGTSWATIMTIPFTQTGTGTVPFSISQIGFHPTTDPNINIDGTDYTPIIVSAALPIELLSFKAKPIGEHALLNWETLTEKNNKGFNIERSNDGVFWNKIGWVNGNGTTESSQKYHFLDEKTQKANNYYRLGQEDTDGKITFSNIEIINFKTKIVGTVNIFPNPASVLINLQWSEAINEELTLTLIDITGKVILNDKVFINDKHTLELSNTLAQGNYVLKVFSENMGEISSQVVTILK
jgi:Secretion system C-terminal sorting domain